MLYIRSIWSKHLAGSVFFVTKGNDLIILLDSSAGCINKTSAKSIRDILAGTLTADTLFDRFWTVWSSMDEVDSAEDESWLTIAIGTAYAVGTECLETWAGTALAGNGADELVIFSFDDFNFEFESSLVTTTNFSLLDVLLEDLVALLDNSLVLSSKLVTLPKLVR